MGQQVLGDSVQGECEIPIPYNRFNVAPPFAVECQVCFSWINRAGVFTPTPLMRHTVIFGRNQFGRVEAMPR